MSDLSHLSPDTQRMLALPNEQRVSRLLVDRFIVHERLAPVIDHVDFLFHAPKASRAAGLVVYGPPGSGKTMLSLSIVRRFPRDPATPTSAPTRPVVAINMTGAREAKTLYNRLLTALDCPLGAAGVGGSDRERLLLRLCRSAGLKLLVVDEIQDILTSTARQQRIALDTIKFLMNELGLSIVVMGTLQAKIAMELDEHLNARFKYRQLPVWQADAYLARFLATLEPSLPLKLRSRLASPALMKRLVQAGHGSLDGIVTHVCHAAVYAIERQVERITPEMIDLAQQAPPITALRLAALSRSRSSEVHAATVSSEPAQKESRAAA